MPPPPSQYQNPDFYRSQQQGLPPGAQQQMQPGGDMMMDNYGDPMMMGAPMSPYTSLPPSLTEQQLRFLDLPDEVPAVLRDRLWGLFTRHSELSNIFDTNELTRARRRVRLICRPMMWENSSQKREGDITFLERMQIEHFVDLLLRKSYKQQERRLLAPWLQEITQRADMAEANQSRSHGVVGRGLNAIFGGGGRR